VRNDILKNRKPTLASKSKKTTTLVELKKKSEKSCGDLIKKVVEQSVTRKVLYDKERDVYWEPITKFVFNKETHSVIGKYDDTTNTTKKLSKNDVRECETQNWKIDRSCVNVEETCEEITDTEEVEDEEVDVKDEEVDEDEEVDVKDEEVDEDEEADEEVEDA